MKSLFSSKNKQIDPTRLSSHRGFSIVEVAIALGVVTLLLTTFLGVFGPAQKSIQRALSTKDANRMKDTLSNEMSILRSTDTAYSSSFEKAFAMIEGSHSKATAVLMYQYKATPVDDDDDGILPAYNATGGIQGRDYIIQTAVRTLGVDDTKIAAELIPSVVNGPVFAVRMTQLVDTDATDSQLILAAWAEADGTIKPGITDPDAPGTVITDSASYPKAVIAFRAEFFKLNSNQLGYVQSTTSNSWNFDNIGNAATEANIAIRR
jgi:hypothetical protein